MLVELRRIRGGFLDVCCRLHGDALFSPALGAKDFAPEIILLYCIAILILTTILIYIYIYICMYIYIYISLLLYCITLYRSIVKQSGRNIAHNESQKWNSIGNCHWESIRHFLWESDNPLEPSTAKCQFVGKCHWTSTTISEVLIAGVQSFCP